jgi:hypothetical protein
MVPLVGSINICNIMVPCPVLTDGDEGYTDGSSDEENGDTDESEDGDEEASNN